MIIWCRGGSLVVEFFTRCEALGSIHSTAEENEDRRDNDVFRRNFSEDNALSYLPPSKMNLYRVADETV